MVKCTSLFVRLATITTAARQNWAERKTVKKETKIQRTFLASVTGAVPDLTAMGVGIENLISLRSGNEGHRTFAKTPCPAPGPRNDPGPGSEVVDLLDFSLGANDAAVR